MMPSPWLQLAINMLSLFKALGQCSTFLQSHLRSGIEQIATTSTGEAARQLHRHSDGTSSAKLHACISSKVCAQEDVYDLVILQDGIQNSSSEYDVPGLFTLYTG